MGKFWRTDKRAFTLSMTAYFYYLFTQPSDGNYLAQARKTNLTKMTWSQVFALLLSPLPVFLIAIWREMPRNAARNWMLFIFLEKRDLSIHEDSYYLMILLRFVTFGSSEAIIKFSSLEDSVLRSVTVVETVQGSRPFSSFRKSVPVGGRLLAQVLMFRF